MYDKDAHHQLARKVAHESMVLLKNEDQILPLPKKGKIAVIGELAASSRFHRSRHFYHNNKKDIYPSFDGWRYPGRPGGQSDCRAAIEAKCGCSR